MLMKNYLLSLIRCEGNKKAHIKMRAGYKPNLCLSADVAQI